MHQNNSPTDSTDEISEKIEQSVIMMARLTTGEEVIGSFVYSEDGKMVTIVEPFFIHTSFDENTGKEITSLLDYMPWAPQPKLASFTSSGIVTIFRPRKEMIDYYSATKLYSYVILEKQNVEGLVKTTEGIVQALNLVVYKQSEVGYYNSEGEASPNQIMQESKTVH